MDIERETDRDHPADPEDSESVSVGEPAPAGFGHPVARNGFGAVVPLDFTEKAFFAKAEEEACKTGLTVDEFLDRWDNTSVGPGPFRLLTLEELIYDVKADDAGDGNDV